MDFSIVAFSYILVIIPLTLLHLLKIDIGKEIAINSIRALLQLVALGFVLGFLFEIQNHYYYILVVGFMLSYSSYVANKRTPFSFWFAFLSLGLATTIILSTLLTFRIISLKPNEFIPIAGMIIGNALNSYTLTIERLKREINLQKDLIEALVSVGASYSEALKIMQKEAIKASLIPVNNTLQTIGVVAIPGITTGMLLAGADPLKAVGYQIIIIYMLVSINLFSSLFGSYFFIKKSVLR
jgi:putative ABC transport system permease protein